MSIVLTIFYCVFCVKKEEKKERRKALSFYCGSFSFEEIPLTGSGTIFTDCLGVQKFAICDKFFTLSPFRNHLDENH